MSINIEGPRLEDMAFQRAIISWKDKKETRHTRNSRRRSRLTSQMRRIVRLLHHTAITLKKDHSKADSAKKSKATEDSNGKKGYAHTKVEKVMSFLSVKSNKLYCMFLQGAIPLFEHANGVLQTEELCIIHSMHRTLINTSIQICSQAT